MKAVGGVMIHVMDRCLQKYISHRQTACGKLDKLVCLFTKCALYICKYRPVSMHFLHLRTLVLPHLG